MAKYCSFRNGGQTDEQGISQFIDKLFPGEVITGFQVTQQDTPNIGIKVTLDSGGAASAMIPSGDLYPYMVFMDAVENISLATPDGSNPRIDLIVGYVDLSVVDDTNPNNPGAFLIDNVTGTPSGSPAVPNAAAIQAVIGASNPYVIFARVAVAAGASTITNANVTDVRDIAQLLHANLGNSSDWAWTSWTPTWTNLTISSSTVSAFYTQIGKTILFKIKITGAGAFDVTSTPVYFSLPVTAHTNYSTTDVLGEGNCQDASAGTFFKLQVWRGDTTAKGRLLTHAVSTYVTVTDLNTTVPFDWTTSDVIDIHGFYEAA